MKNSEEPEGLVGRGAVGSRLPRAGAVVAGLDISEGMLAVARRRISAGGLEEQIELHQADVLEMDTLFAENSFDVITSTLVISELYAQERQWALRQLHRILKPTGTLIIAGEVRPEHPLKQLVYRLLRWPLALVAFAIQPAWALITSAIFWGAGLVLYASYPLLPFQSGWLKALLLGAVTLAVFMAVSFSATGSPWHYGGWMAFCLLAILSLGFDLKGIVGDRTSEAEALMHRLGFDTFGHFFRARGVHKGRITQDKSRCVNCQTCRRVCPMGVYGIAENKRDVIIVNAPACLQCSACVRQCEKEALALV